MSCKCSELNESLPSVVDDYATSNPTSVATPCNKDACFDSDSSEGKTLSNDWLDTCCNNENVTLLARVGNKLSRFTGTGFLSFDAGKASMVANVPLRLVHIWHRWWKPTPASPPILGEPLDFSYQAVGDSKGNIHAIKGMSDEDSETVWKHTEKVFQQVPQSEVKRPLKGLLPRSSALELVGYAAIPENGSATEVRQQSTLQGSGLLWADPVPTVDTECACAPEPSLASVVTSLPFPDGEGPYTLKYSLAEGLYWSEDA